VCGLLRARRDAMLDALANELPEGSRWSRPEGGYFIWLDLPDGLRTDEVAAHAAEAGIAFVNGSDFFPGGAGGESALRLAYSFASVDEIGEGVARLAGLLTPAAATAL
jgi:DNA-binding transcriptional MocR family regulator